MAKSTTEHDKQSDAGEPVELEKSTGGATQELWPTLAPKELLVHNGVFDLGFLNRMGFMPAGAVYDTLLTAKLLVAGTGEKATLEACCRRWLGLGLESLRN